MNRKSEPANSAASQMRAQTRELSSQDEAHIASVLSELRAHFHEWKYIENEYELIGFAYYEGCGDAQCCGAILSKAAPLALGKELIADHGFKWVMVRSEGGWHFGISHPTNGLLIDLETLEDGRLLVDNQAALAAGERTYESYGPIVELIDG